MNRLPRPVAVLTALLATALALALAEPALAAEWTLVGWNNLGMHCMDADYALFSLLPPYNTVMAQLIDPDGRLVRDPAAAGIEVSYQAVADPAGSINSSSIDKSNFWQHAEALFGVALAPDAGLAGFRMPGPSNTPQPMGFDASRGCFVAEGVPITPYDDAGHKNPYPLMRLVARRGGELLASADVVLPVSDEMDCSACHASGSSLGARPFRGWADDPDPQRDMRLNILRLHDDRESFRPAFQQALRDVGYDAAGLEATALAGRAVLCARCHSSEALPGSGLVGVTPLTTAVHRRMAFVYDPVSGTALDALDNRSACYRCHPGSVTRCLRGAMGAAVGADGAPAMQCQSCHGRMVDVASTERTGWLDEPNCQSCHTGTAMRNNGRIRYTSVFEDDGSARAALDDTFATNPDTPAPGLSLYRFSTGHGGLACEACHGATHAEYPSLHANDNLLSLGVQGHEGMLVECAACHGNARLASFGGPHGMHPVGQEWVERHPDEAEEGGAARCRDCHGADLRGTVLSRVKGERDLDADDFGRKRFWRGFQVGCWTCHLGPDGEHANPNRAAVVADVTTATLAGVAVSVPLSAEDADGDALELRVVAQPSHGTAALDGAAARYLPEAGFVGRDSFTYAAWDGSTDSNLATVTVDVAGLSGDANCDGRISVADVGAVLTRIADEAAPVCDADADGDGEVEAGDVDAMVRRLFAP